MEPIIGVWLTSLVGATAFSAAGYVLGQRGVVLPFLRLDASERATVVPKAHAGPASTPPPSVRDDRPTPQIASPDLLLGDEADTEGATAIVTVAQADAMRVEEALVKAEDALAKAEQATERARAAEAAKAELERRAEALRSELREEVLARATASARADELDDRLARASEEAAGLRHKVALLDKQAKQLREALQGRVRALTTSEWHRRRDLEESEEMRGKLRDVYDQIERTSSPPANMAITSPPPATGSASSPPKGTDVAARTSSPPISVPAGSIPSHGDEGFLRTELTRLAAENRDLRALALGSVPPKKSPSRGSVPELDLDLYRALVDRLAGVDGVRAAVIADELGSLLVGSGDLADGLAAFGAYIRDASSRTDRLLPLEGVDEVDIRDRTGLLLATRVIVRAPSELCLVLLGTAGAPLDIAKKIAEETLRLR